MSLFIDAGFSGVATVKRGSSLQAKNNPQIYANPRELFLISENSRTNTLTTLKCCHTVSQGGRIFN